MVEIGFLPFIERAHNEPLFHHPSVLNTIKNIVVLRVMSKLNRNYVLKELETMKKRELEKELEKLRETLSEGYDHANQIIHSIPDYFDGDIYGLYSFMIEEGICGKYLEYEFAMKHERYHPKFENALISFVKKIDRRRRKMSDSENRVKKIFPRVDAIEGKEKLSNEDLDSLESAGIYSLMAARLRQLEEVYGISQKEVYEAIAIPQTTCSDWWNGVIPHRHFAIIKMIRWLRERLDNPSIDFEWLITCTDRVVEAAHSVMSSEDKKEMEKLKFENASMKLQLEHQQDLLDQGRERK